jgi:hypothetical protein
VGDNIQIFGSRGDSDTVIAGGGDDFVNTKDADGLDNILCGEGTNDFVIKDAGDTAFDCEGIG